MVNGHKVSSKQFVTGAKIIGTLMVHIPTWRADARPLWVVIMTVLFSALEMLAASSITDATYSKFSLHF